MRCNRSLRSRWSLQGFCYRRSVKIQRTHLSHIVFLVWSAIETRAFYLLLISSYVRQNLASASQLATDLIQERILHPGTICQLSAWITLRLFQSYLVKKFKKGTVCSAATVVTFRARTTESLLAGLKSFNLNHRQFTPVAQLPHRSSAVPIKPETGRVFKTMHCYCYFYLFNSNPIISDSNPLFPFKCQTIFFYKYRLEGEKAP